MERRDLIVLLGLLSLMVGVFAVSCTSDTNLVVGTFEQKEKALALPDEAFHDAIWISNSKLLIRHEPPPVSMKSHRVWQYDLITTEFKELQIPYSPDYCRFTESSVQQVLDENDLIVLARCIRNERSDTGIMEARAFRWNLKTGEFIEVRDYKLPKAAGVISFSKDLELGVFSSITRIRDSLFKLDSDTWTEINLPLARAYRPSVSSDGKRLAFLGNKSMSGEPSHEWAGRPYDLFVLPATCLEDWTGDCEESLHPIATKLRNATKLAWSNDGTSIVFDGSLGSHGLGIWIIDTRTNEIVKAATGKYSGPSLSFDGKRIAIIGDWKKMEGTRFTSYEAYSKVYLLDKQETVKPTED